MDINKELVELYTLEQKAKVLQAKIEANEAAIYQKKNSILNVEENGWDQTRFFAPPELLEQGVIVRISASYEGCDIDFLPVER